MSRNSTGEKVSITFRAHLTALTTSALITHRLTYKINNNKIVFHFYFCNAFAPTANGKLLSFDWSLSSSSSLDGLETTPAPQSQLIIKFALSLTHIFGHKCALPIPSLAHQMNRHNTHTSTSMNTIDGRCFGACANPRTIVREYGSSNWRHCCYRRHWTGMRHDWIIYTHIAHCVLCGCCSCGRAAFEDRCQMQANVRNLCSHRTACMWICVFFGSYNQINRMSLYSWVEFVHKNDRIFR